MWLTLNLVPSVLLLFMTCSCFSYFCWFNQIHSSFSLVNVEILLQFSILFIVSFPLSVFITLYTFLYFYLNWDTNDFPHHHTLIPFTKCFPQKDSPLEPFYFPSLSLGWVLWTSSINPSPTWEPENPTPRNAERVLIAVDDISLFLAGYVVYFKIPIYHSDQVSKNYS